MTWTLMSLHLKQSFEGGYRYLDQCGEFMLVAEEKFGLVPGEAKPSGAKMEMPEQGISLYVDTTELVIQQDYPTDDGGLFIGFCEELSRLVEVMFRPSQVTKNGFLSRWYCQFPSVEAAMKASLSFAPEISRKVGNAVDMVPIFADWNFGYESGSMDFFVKMESVKMDTAFRSYASGFGESARARERVERLNLKGDRLPKSLKHALAINFDLMEEQPPPGSLFGHFASLQRHQAELLKIFSLR